MTGFAVLATMRNEGPFLLEWVAHHKALGFDDIVICTNDCADGTDAMVRRLAEMGLARHHQTVKRGSSIQRAAYRQARDQIRERMIGRFGPPTEEDKRP